METQKIINLWHDSSNEGSKFCTKKWYVIDSQVSKHKYNQSNSIKFETESIKSSLFGYFDAFILVTEDIAVTTDNYTDAAFQIVHHFLYVRQKLMMCLLMKQIIFTLQYL